MKLEHWPNYHKGRVGLGIYANQTCPSLMTFALAPQFHVYLPWVDALCLNSVLNLKALVGALNYGVPQNYGRTEIAPEGH